jgi:hypothetical protein
MAELSKQERISLAIVPTRPFDFVSAARLSMRTSAELLQAQVSLGPMRRCMPQIACLTIGAATFADVNKKWNFLPNQVVYWMNFMINLGLHLEKRTLIKETASVDIGILIFHWSILAA